MFGEANDAAKKSAEDARAAKEDAKSAVEVADKFRYWNNFAMIAAAIGFLGICITALSFLFTLSSRNDEIATKLRIETETAQDAIEEHVLTVDRHGLQTVEASAALPGLRSTVGEQRREIEELKKEIAALRAEMSELRSGSIRIPKPPRTQ